MQLAKNQSINLAKANQAAPLFHFGGAWGQITRKKTKLFGLISTGETKESVDLDLCAFAISADHEVLRECSYRRPDCGFMKSSGDDRSGGLADDENETITVDINKLPAGVRSIVFVINSYSKQSFDEVPFTSIRVYEGQPNRPTKVHCEYRMEGSEYQGMRTVIVGELVKQDNGWVFTAVGETRTYHSINSFIDEVHGRS